MFQFNKLEILMIAELNNLVKLIYGYENPVLKTYSQVASGKLWHASLFTRHRFLHS